MRKIAYWSTLVLVCVLAMVFLSQDTLAVRGLGTVDIGTMYLGGTKVTSTAAEINILDTVTAVAADLNAIAGIDGNLSVTGTQIDIPTGFTFDVDDVGGLKIGNVATTWSAAESNLLTGITTTVAADITAIAGIDGNLSVTGTQIDIPTGFTLDIDDVGGLKVGNVATSWSAAESNILTGVTGTVAADITAIGGADGNITFVTTEMNIPTGFTLDVADVGALQIANVAVSPDAAEINILDGVTTTVAADITAIAGADGNITFVTTETNIPTGFTLDIADVGALQIANVAVAPDAAEINILDGVTGTVAADITAIAGFDGNVSVTTTQTDIATGTTFNVVDVGGLEIGDVSVTPDAAEINILNGVTGTVAADITAIAGFDGNISVTTTQTDIATGTTFNVVDVGGFEIGDVSVTADAAELSIMDGVTATAAEINAHVDPTGRMVTSAGTENITVAAHAGRIVLLTGAGALTRTLPAATGTGNVYRFVVGVVNASHIITVNGTPGTDTIDGGAIGMQTVEGWEATGAVNTVTLNGTTTGGQIGDWVEIIDIAAGQFSVTAQIVQTGAQATPFS
jgi:hypothetical protein